jgi:hypothetical protein
MTESFRQMPPLRVPSRYRTGLSSVAQLTDADVLALQQSLNVGPTELSIEDLAAQVEGKISSDIDAKRLLEAVASLLGLLPESGAGADRLAQEIGEAESLEIPDDERASYVARLKTLMGIPALAVFSRATDVMTEQEKIFHDVRILTDVRPVFEPDVSEGVKAAGVVASMKIEYHPMGRREIEAVFVSMDRGDLEHLGRVVSRALAKMDSLGDLLKESQVPQWSFRYHTHGAG